MANLKTMMNIRNSQNMFQRTTKSVILILREKKENIGGLVGIQNEIHSGKSG